MRLLRADGIRTTCVTVSPASFSRTIFANTEEERNQHKQDFLWEKETIYYITNSLFFFLQRSKPLFLVIVAFRFVRWKKITFLKTTFKAQTACMSSDCLRSILPHESRSEQSVEWECASVPRSRRRSRWWRRTAAFAPLPTSTHGSRSATPAAKAPARLWVSRTTFQLTRGRVSRRWDEREIQDALRCSMLVAASKKAAFFITRCINSHWCSAKSVTNKRCEESS